MIHYHGGPITPETCALRVWSSRHAFISFAHPNQLAFAASITQSFALDNGAFSLWKARKPVHWSEYYSWVKDWKTHPGFDFAVVPDVIDGTEEENDALAESWPFERHAGAVVWHINESFDRLRKLATSWPRVCIGSSGQWDVAKPAEFLKRAVPAIHHICGNDGRPVCKLHGLRMLNPAIFTTLPLASADSTNIARNIGIDSAWRGTYQPRTKETRAVVLAERIEAHNSAEHLTGWDLL